MHAFAAVGPIWETQLHQRDTFPKVSSRVPCWLGFPLRPLLRQPASPRMPMPVPRLLSEVTSVLF
jgi:hypothetical protein